jgi:hypothetical protein
LGDATLQAYRQAVGRKHEAAVALGVCVGWQNSVGITVTLNPGLASGTAKDGSKLDFFAFSAVDPVTNYYVIMNGPEQLTVDGKSTRTDNLDAYIYDHDEEAAQNQMHKFTKVLTHDKNGQWYYTDAQTGEPLIDTVVTTGELTFDHLKQECNALRNHDDVHAYIDNGALT